MANTWLGEFARDEDEPAQRRESAPIAAANISEAERDPSLGTVSLTTLTRVAEQEHNQVGGALLFIDLDANSARLAPAISVLQDENLIWLAQAIVQCVRREDLVAHVDSYKFAMLLRGAKQEIAASVAERILRSVENTIFLTGEGIAPLGVDIGGVVFPVAETRAADLVRSASDQLDTARANDRRVWVE